jgi:predicted HTH domain antitoxin
MRRLARGHIFGRAGHHDPAARVAALGPQIDHVVGRLDHVHVVLDQHNPLGRIDWAAASVHRAGSGDRDPKGRIIDERHMPITIPDEVLTAAHITEPELKQELALTLFQQERLTLSQASRLAELDQLAFQALLAERQIPIHYGIEEFRADLRTLRQMGRL